MGNIIFEFPASYAQRVAFGLVVGTLSQITSIVPETNEKDSRQYF